MCCLTVSCGRLSALWWRWFCSMCTLCLCYSLHCRQGVVWLSDLVIEIINIKERLAWVAHSIAMERGSSLQTGDCCFAQLSALKSCPIKMSSFQGRGVPSYCALIEWDRDWCNVKAISRCSARTLMEHSVKLAQVSGTRWPIIQREASGSL